MTLREFEKRYSLTLKNPKDSKKNYKGSPEKILYVRFSPELSDTKQDTFVCSKGAAEASRNKTVKFKDLEVTFSEDLQRWGLIRPDSNLDADVDMD